MAQFVRNDVETVEMVETVEVPTLVIGGLSPATERAVRALVAADEAITENAKNGRRQNVVVRISKHGSYASLTNIEAPVGK